MNFFLTFLEEGMDWDAVVGGSNLTDTIIMAQIEFEGYTSTGKIYEGGGFSTGDGYGAGGGQGYGNYYFKGLGRGSQCESFLLKEQGRGYGFAMGQGEWTLDGYDHYDENEE